MPTAPHTLSPELDDHLMSMLAGDSTTLKACALVCKAWLAASRVYLFRNIIFQTASAPEHFEEVNRCTFPVDTLLRVLIAFPALKDLSIKDYAPPQLSTAHLDEHEAVEIPYAAIDAQVSPTLARLQLSYYVYPRKMYFSDAPAHDTYERNPVIDFLATRLMVDELKILDVTFSEHISPLDISSLLHYAGSHVEALQSEYVVGVKRSFWDIKHISLGTLTRLRHFSFVSMNAIGLPYIATPLLASVASTSYTATRGCRTRTSALS
ncbi:hypothetical protein EUX98_g6845 [Antrodiella citrinella]|uniref:F-box domain-containing protein n=1 Tax=Antrodiella citrinella TaxID=2447956 RepID=A0A4S4MPS5_9APHY|nr:hypothetical protein EUX98_g6845 [Antrodiella citrinella]